MIFEFVYLKTDKLFIFFIILNLKYFMEFGTSDNYVFSLFGEDKFSELKTAE